MSDNFLPFAGGVTSTAGKLLAVNPRTVAAIFSQWSREHDEYQLILLLLNNRQIKIREHDAANALGELGLGEFADSWILNLAEDIG